MTTGSFRKPFTTLLLATPIALFVGIWSAGAGHGDYVEAILLFPYTMLLATVHQEITDPLLLLAIAQFPIYGLILGLANTKGRMDLAGTVLVLAHIAAVVVMLSSPALRQWSQ